MSLRIDLNKFNELYNNQLLPKEEILKELNITEYFYKKIIKEFNIKRIKRTCEFERIKNANKDFITVIKHDDPENITVIKQDDKYIEKEQKKDNKEQKHIKKKKQDTKQDIKYNEAISEAMNILKISRRTLNDKEIF